RRCDRSVALCKHRVVTAVVAGGYHYHDSRFPRGFDHLAERVELVALEYGAAKRQVDDTDVVSILKVDRSLNGGDHIGFPSTAVFGDRDPHACAIPAVLPRETCAHGRCR